MHFFTEIQAINDLRFVPMPTSPKPMQKLVCVGNTVVALGHDGKLYATGRTVKGSFMRVAGSQHTLIRAAIKLGLLDKTTTEAWLREGAEHETARQKKYAAAAIIRNAKEFGLKLSPTQIAKLGKFNGAVE